MQTSQASPGRPTPPMKPLQDLPHWEGFPVVRHRFAASEHVHQNRQLCLPGPPRVWVVRFEGQLRYDKWKVAHRVKAKDCSQIAHRRRETAHCRSELAHYMRETARCKSRNRSLS